MPGPPVLDYEQVPVGGVFVHRLPDRLTIVLPPSDLWGHLRSGVTCAAHALLLPLAIAVTAIVVVSAARGVWPAGRVIGVVLLCGALSAASVALSAVLGAVVNQAALVEALPAAVRLALVGRASRRASVISTWPRSEIIAIDVGVYGVRLRLRGKRRARWIAVGTQSQSRRICQLLREELNLRPS